MSQTIRITVTPELEKALQILRESTMGTLNTTELIKMAVGELAQIKKAEMDKISYSNNIAHPEKLKPFIPKKENPDSDYATLDDLKKDLSKRIAKEKNLPKKAK